MLSPHVGPCRQTAAPGVADTAYSGPGKADDQLAEVDTDSRSTPKQRPSCQLWQHRHMFSKESGAEHLH